MVLDPYDNKLIEKVRTSAGILWHIHQSNFKDVRFAKQIIFALSLAGKKIFPDINTVWHFDDKIAQKYIFELNNINTVETSVFYDKQTALEWAKTAKYPLVFKLRSGASSSNVQLIENLYSAKKKIEKAFRSGFQVYDRIGNLKDRWNKFRQGKSNFINVFSGLYRLLVVPSFASDLGREKGYVYFQKFIPGNSYDIRVVVVADKAFAIKRFTRKGDFRASGSGIIDYRKENFSHDLVKYAFEIQEKFNFQCMAYDFIWYIDKWVLLEMSYGFSPDGYKDCEGYWDKDLNWFESNFNPYGWMIQSLLSNNE